MAGLPSGTITFVITDLSGFTQRMEQDPARARAAVLEHFEVVEGAVRAFGGSPFNRVGDAVLASFGSAEAAVRGALQAREAVNELQWPDGSPLRIKIAIVTGEAEATADGDYLEPTVNRGSRLCSELRPNQLVVSSLTASLVRGRMPEGVNLVRVGRRAFRDCPEDEFFQICADDEPALEWKEPNRAGNLPPHPRQFIGRERELLELTDKLASPDQRLVTIVGLGGMGKTRLSVELGRLSSAHVPDGVWFVECGDLLSGTQLAEAIATAMVLECGGDWDEIANTLRDQACLLILDCFEGVLDAGPRIAELVHRCPKLK